MKATLLALTLLITTSAEIGWDRPDEQLESSARDETKALMRAKLQGSQSVLDGLVSENFSLVRRGAEQMKGISETVQWPRAQDPVYDHFGDEFRRHCDELMELADASDLRGAHFTYLSMTTTCISCHNYVRKSFRVERDDTNPQGPVRLIPTEWEGKAKRLKKSAQSPNQLRKK